MFYSDLVLLPRLSCRVEVFLVLYRSFSLSLRICPVSFQDFTQFYLSLAILLNGITSKSICR